MSDNIKYLKKYLKYKIKYLELKNKKTLILEGGKISKLKKISRLTLKKISRLTLKQTQTKINNLYNYLLSLINDIDILIDLKYEKNYYEFIKLLVTIDKIESKQELINLNNLITLFFITQKTLILDLYNNNNYKHLIIPLITSLLNSQVYQNEIKIFLKYSVNEEIIKLLEKSSNKVIIDYLKNR